MCVGGQADSSSGAEPQRCEDEAANPGRDLRVLEFFAGMGGMKVALSMASGTPSPGASSARVVGAFEISEVCEKAYLHNFPSGKTEWKRGTIESLTAARVDAYGADVWLMSPPCQPFTRSGNRLDTEDTRTRALLRLVELLPQLRRPPCRILLENVIGFERSDSRLRLLRALAELGWEVAEFDARPEDVGLPNSRPRYYGLFRNPAVGQLGFPAPPASNTANERWCWRLARDVMEEPAVLQRWYLDPDQPTEVSPLGHVLVSADKVAVEEGEMSCAMEIPVDVMSDAISRGVRYDLHLRKELTSACFTKSYGRFPRGYGPMVLVDPAEEENVEQRPKLSAQKGKQALEEIGDDEADVQTAVDAKMLFNVWPEGSRLRYLTPSEQLRLMGYPDTYTLPATLKMRDRFSLIGNSVNVRVVSNLIRDLLVDPSVASASSNLTA